MLKNILNQSMKEAFNEESVMNPTIKEVPIAC